jgi:HK97 family phage major capsid protein
MADLMTQARELASVVEAKKAEASKAWTALEELKTSAIAEGVDFASNTEAFDKIDAAGKSYDTVADEVKNLEGKRARLLEIAAQEVGAKASDISGDVKADAKSYGEAFVKSDVYRAAISRAAQSGNTPIGTTDGVKVMDRDQVKTLLSVTVSGANGLSGVPIEDRTGLIVGTPLASLDFLNVIATATTDSDLVEWVEESTYTNAAAETAEGTSVPESALAFTVKTSNVREIPHFIPVTRRALSDAAFVESWINNRLVDGVRRRLQTQVLTGNGSGENLRGIYNTSGIGSIDRSTLSVNMLEGLHKAITTVRTNAFIEPDFIGIHPDDWEAIRLLREGSGTGQYLYGSPAEAGAQTIWGKPAIIHSAFTSGAPLVGVGREATLFVREGVSVSASDSHSDYFIKRQVALLATMRAAFAVTQPKAFAACVA